MSTKVTTQTEVRLSYTYLLEAHAQDENDEPKFSTALLIPKSDTETVKALRAAINEALADGVAKKWKGKKPSDLHNPLRDGDKKEDKDGNPDELYAGHWFLNAKGPRGGAEAPILLNKANEPTESSSVIYSGVYARVSLQFYPYDTRGNKGVAAGVTAVKSMEHGDALGSVVTVASAREEFGDEPGAVKDAKDEFAADDETETKSTSSKSKPADDDDDPWKD